MKCLSEDVLALFVEGDLPPVKAAAVDGHVRSCDPCSQLLAELRESQSFLKSVRHEPVSATALASVRTRVLEGVREMKSPSGWFGIERFLIAARGRYAMAGFAIAVLASGLVWHWSWSPQQEAPAPIALTPPAPVVATPRPAIQEHIQPKPVRTVRRKKAAPAREETNVAGDEPRQIVMKIVTDDPNIVIYWLFDEKGAGE